MPWSKGRAMRVTSSVAVRRQPRFGRLAASTCGLTVGISPVVRSHTRSALCRSSAVTVEGNCTAARCLDLHQFTAAILFGRFQCKAVLLRFHGP